MSPSFLRPWFYPILFLSCNHAATLQQPCAPAFYCWQTNFSLPDSEAAYLHEIACKNLYVKILDIGLEAGSAEIVPYAQIQLADTSGLSAYQLVGTVFITNAVFQALDTQQTNWLADKIETAYRNFRQNTPHSRHIELQIDCDWTAGTRDKFFQFLSTLKKLLPPEIRLGATIRLHQYKFPKDSGVPPVDRGMLMCYNTGDIDEATTRNSIFDLDDARKYIVGAPKDYPLALDLALPAYSWTLVYRASELWKIIPGDQDGLPVGILQAGTFLNGHYLRPGDLIRHETISADLLKNAARLAASIDLAADAKLAFFHLNRSTPRDFPAPLIKEVCHIADSIRAIK